MPTNGRWQGTLDRAFHRVDDDSVAVDVVLVVDGKVQSDKLTKRAA